MGNACIEGGAKVECTSNDFKHVTASAADNGDGTYSLVWRSLQSGIFDVQVTIEEEPISSSPFQIELVSDTPDLTKTVASGPGLSKSVTAGIVTQVHLRLLDKYSNVATPKGLLRFGLTKARSEQKDEKLKWKTKDSDRFDGRWVEDEFDMSYYPRRAGDTDVYLWTEQDGRRELIPGSPFKTHCSAGEADASGSRIEGLSKEELVTDKSEAKAKSSSSDLKQGNTKNVQEKAVQHGMVGSGETIVIRPSICDAFGNATTAKDGALTIVVSTADGSQQWELVPDMATRSGMATYDARFEPKVQGEYVVDVALSRVPVRGSPVRFKVHAGAPDMANSQVALPEGPLWAQHHGQVFSYEVTLIAVDKNGNPCTKGGGVVTARLGGSIAPTDPNVEVEDLDNGTYSMHVAVKAAGDLKLYIATGGSESEYKLTFLNRAAALQKEQREKQGGAGRRASVSPDVLARQLSQGLGVVDPVAAAAAAAAAEGSTPQKRRQSSSNLMAGLSATEIIALQSMQSNASSSGGQ